MDPVSIIFYQIQCLIIPQTVLALMGFWRSVFRDSSSRLHPPRFLLQDSFILKDSSLQAPPGFLLQNSYSTIPSPGFPLQDSSFRIPPPRFLFHDSSYRISPSGFLSRIHSSRFLLQVSSSRIPPAEFLLQESSSRISPPRWFLYVVFVNAAWGRAPRLYLFILDFQSNISIFKIQKTKPTGRRRFSICVY